MWQPSIDDVAPTRLTDPVTSRMAAASVDVGAKQRLTLRALAGLRRSNPQPVEAWRVRRRSQAINNREHPKARPLGESTIRTRLNELTARGLVEVADRLGVTESGGTCQRYRLTAAGVEEARRWE